MTLAVYPLPFTRPRYENTNGHFVLRSLWLIPFCSSCKVFRQPCFRLRRSRPQSVQPSTVLRGLGQYQSKAQRSVGSSRPFPLRTPCLAGLASGLGAALGCQGGGGALPPFRPACRAAASRGRRWRSRGPDARPSRPERRARRQRRSAASPRERRAHLLGPPPAACRRRRAAPLVAVASRSLVEVRRKRALRQRPQRVRLPLPARRLRPAVRHGSASAGSSDRYPSTAASSARRTSAPTSGVSRRRTVTIPSSSTHVRGSRPACRRRRQDTTRKAVTSLLRSHSSSTARKAGAERFRSPDPRWCLARACHAPRRRRPNGSEGRARISLGAAARPATPAGFR